MLSKRLLPLRRQLSTASRLRRPLKSGPAPPRLPEKDQKIFEELQKSSTGAFSTPRPLVNQSPSSVNQTKVNQSPQGQRTQAQTARIEAGLDSHLEARIQAKGEGEELHPDVRRGAAPEFEGDKNPKTGEVGGPKNEPLRWGANADWSYNGRVTDF